MSGIPDSLAFLSTSRCRLWTAAEVMKQGNTLYNVHAVNLNKASLNLLCILWRIDFARCSLLRKASSSEIPSSRLVSRAVCRIAFFKRSSSRTCWNKLDDLVDSCVMLSSFSEGSLMLRAMKMNDVCNFYLQFVSLLGNRISWTSKRGTCARRFSTVDSALAALAAGL